MRVLRSVVTLFAVLLALSSFSPTQAQVEENKIYLPIILNNYKVRSETVYIREETVQLLSEMSSTFGKPVWLGIVRNDSSQTKKDIEVEELYYNSTNQLIGNRTSIILGAIPPDGERCFGISISSGDFAGFTKASLRIVSFSDEDPQKYRSLSVENFSKVPIDFYYPSVDKIFQYQGTIHNEYSVTLYQTIVTITGFDNSGRVAECVKNNFNSDGFYPDQYYYFTLGGYVPPETISHTIIDVSGSVERY